MPLCVKKVCLPAPHGRFVNSVLLEAFPCCEALSECGCLTKPRGNPNTLSLLLTLTNRCTLVGLRTHFVRYKKSNFTLFTMFEQLMIFHEISYSDFNIITSGFVLFTKCEHFAKGAYLQYGLITWLHLKNCPCLKQTSQNSCFHLGKNWTKIWWSSLYSPVICTITLFFENFTGI